REDLGAQLHDDRRGDVRDHVQREQAEALQRATGEHVEHVHDAALVADQAGHRLRIDARDRDVATDAVDDQGADHEQQALPQLGELAHPADATHCAGATTQSRYSSTWPPAASIAARAPAVVAMPLSTSFRDSSPLLTILAR